MRKTPFIVGGLLFMLVMFFFIASPERFLYPSRASQERVRLFFTPTEIMVQALELVPISIYMQTNPSVPVSQAQLSLMYDPSILAVDSTGDRHADPACEANNFFLTEQEGYHNDITTGTVTLTRRASATERDGLFCWGTIYFKALKEGMTEVSLPTTLDDSFLISGSQGELLPIQEEREVVNITINE